MLAALLFGIADYQPIAGGGLLPATPCAVASAVASVTPLRVSQTHSGLRQVRTGNAQWWAFTLRWDNYERSELEPILTMLLTQRGAAGAVEVPLPVNHRDSQSGVTSSLLSLSAAAGESIIAATGLIGELRVGDFLRFGNHSKLYKLTATTTADSNGVAWLSLFPSLYADVPLATQIIINNLTMRAYVDAGDTTEYQLDQPDIISLSAKFTEALS